METMLKFSPAEDITIQELAEIVALVGIQVEVSWIESSCPDNLKRHWSAADVTGTIPHESH